MENYFLAKRKLFKMLPKKAFALSNADDKYGERILQGIKAHEFLYGLEECQRRSLACFQGKILKLDFSGLELDFNGEKVKSKLLGLHQIGPLSVAADIALRLGISPEKIQQGIAKTKPFNHRLELKNYGDGVILLDDSYNGNPDGVDAVIEFLASLKNHKRFYVTPGLVEMGLKTESVHKEIGKKLAKAGIEKIILIKSSG